MTGNWMKPGNWSPMLRIGGKRTFAAGLGVGILIAIAAVGALNYLDRAGRMSGEKAQDSLKIGSEKADGGRRVPLERNKVREAAITPALPSEAAKAPPPSTPAEPALATPSPIDTAAQQPAERQAPAVSGEAGGKSNDKSVTLAPAEPLEIATGASGHKKPFGFSRARGSSKALLTAALALRWW